MDKKTLKFRPNEVSDQTDESEATDGESTAREGTATTTTTTATTAKPKRPSKEKRKTSGFDSYKFENPVLGDDEEDIRRAEEDAENESERIMQLARLKNADYSKIDIVKMASSFGGLNLAENFVEPIPIPESIEERKKAVRNIYGPGIKPETEPFQDPVKSLEIPPEEEAERIHSPPNLFEALQSSFLKSNYKNHIYRLFILGTHDENLNHLIEYNKEIVDIVNFQSYTEQLLGVLCMYEYYFIHVLEGSEDNLLRLLQRYADDLEPSGYEWDLKFHIKTRRYTGRNPRKFQTVQSWVLGMFKINERRFSTWRGDKVYPNRMHVQDIPEGGFREKYFHFLKQCMIMAFTYNRMAPGQFNPASENEDNEVTSQLKKSIERAKIQRFKSLGKVVTPITFINYVLDHKDNPKLKIRSVREHLDLFGGTPAYTPTTSTEWPHKHTRIAPYD